MIPRVLIGYIDSGETTLPRFLADVGRQQDVELAVEGVHGAQELENHQKLYAKFDELSAEFDVILKMDPDMSFSSEKLFINVVNFFATIGFARHVVIPVWDYLTNRNIWGFHAWKGGARFAHAGHRIFADRLLEQGDCRPLTIPLAQESPVIHLSEGSDEQIYRYVLRRVVKSRAYGRRAWRDFSTIPAEYLLRPNDFRGRALSALSLAVFELPAETVCRFALGLQKAEALPRLVSSPPEVAANRLLDAMNRPRVRRRLGRELDQAYGQLVNREDLAYINQDKLSGLKGRGCSFWDLAFNFPARFHLRKTAGKSLSRHFGHSNSQGSN